eukprot:jgi/Psemu1/41935/gm1.41935_g
MVPGATSLKILVIKRALAPRSLNAPLYTNMYRTFSQTPVTTKYGEFDGKYVAFGQSNLHIRTNHGIWKYYSTDGPVQSQYSKLQLEAFFTIKPSCRLAIHSLTGASGPPCSIYSGLLVVQQYTKHKVLQQDLVGLAPLQARITQVTRALAETITTALTSYQLEVDKANTPQQAIQEDLLPVYLGWAKTEKKENACPSASCSKQAKQKILPVEERWILAPFVPDATTLKKFQAFNLLFRTSPYCNIANELLPFAFIPRGGSLETLKWQNEEAHTATSSTTGKTNVCITTDQTKATPQPEGYFAVLVGTILGVNHVLADGLLQTGGLVQLKHYQMSFFSPPYDACIASKPEFAVGWKNNWTAPELLEYPEPELVVLARRTQGTKPTSLVDGRALAGRPPVMGPHSGEVNDATIATPASPCYGTFARQNTAFVSTPPGVSGSIITQFVRLPPSSRFAAPARWPPCQQWTNPSSLSNNNPARADPKSRVF